MSHTLPGPRSEIARPVLLVIAILLLITGSLKVLQPFLGAMIWAVMIVVATWPVMLAVQARLWGRRGLAVMVMVMVLMLLLFVPLTIAVVTVAEHIDAITRIGPEFFAKPLPEAPEWLAQLPWLGSRLASSWHEHANAGWQALAEMARPYAGSSFKWLAAQAGSLGMVLLQFMLTVVMSAILYSQGEQAVRIIRGFCRRLAGIHGDDVVTLSGQAIRGVAMGIVVTALVQSALGGLGLWVSGVPYAGMLAAIMFLCCLVQLGPFLVLLPALAWLFWTGDTTWGIAFGMWALVVGFLDNFLRPWLIRKGADLPLLLIFAGVIGGLLAFGLIGLFVGPVLLAVTYTLLDAWIGDAYDEPSESAGQGESQG